jgi:predicted permease
VRPSMRGLLRNWRIHGAAVLSLSVAYAVIVFAMSLFDALLWRPLPVPDAGQLVTIGVQNAAGEPDPFSYAAYAHVRDNSRSYAGLTAVPQMILRFAYSDGTRVERSNAALVGTNYFSTLALQPQLGQLSFGPGPDTEATASVVLADAFWRRLGADPSIVGRTILLNRSPVTVVGVAPPGFVGTSFIFEPDLWLPLNLHETLIRQPPGIMGRAGHNWLDLVGRLKPGVTMEAAKAEMDVLWRQLAATDPPLYRDRRPTLSSTRVTAPAERPGVTTYVGLLLGIAALTLVIACGNAINLLIGLGAARQRETLVKAALGASRGRLARALIAESLGLAGLSALVGLGLAYASFAWLGQLDTSRLLPPMYPGILLDWRPDLRVLAATFAVAVVIGLAVGLRYAVRATSFDIASLLSTEGAGAAGGPARAYSRRALVIVELAVATSVLVVAALLFQTIGNLSRAETGLDTARLFSVDMDLGPNGYTPGSGRVMYEQLRDRIAAIGQVEAVTLAVAPPLGDQGWAQDRVEFAQGPFANSERALEVSYSVVDPNYFSTLRIPLVAGRAFDATDTETSAEVIVVNQRMANRFWPGLNPIGQTVRIQRQRTARVVGVVADSKYSSMDEPRRSFMYFNVKQHERDLGSICVIGRTKGNPAAIMGEVRHAVRTVDPNLSAMMLTFDERIAQSLVLPRLTAWSVSIFGAVALLLALLGISISVFCSVTERQRELAVRLALGADIVTLQRMVLRQVGGVAIIGMAFGLGIAIVMSSFVRSLLFQTSVLDPVVVMMACGGMLLITLGAALLAIWRTTRGDLSRGLRHL